MCVCMADEIGHLNVELSADVMMCLTTVRFKSPDHTHISKLNFNNLLIRGLYYPITDCQTLPLFGYHDLEAFVQSIQKPRVIIMLVKVGAPVDQTIKTLSAYMEKGDCIIDGGNVAELGLLYLGNQTANVARTEIPTGRWWSRRTGAA
ncbi:hypothetical protein EZV62_011879 [Acer yangbiense]|uniref:6-phosphogluconate dehydrogenase NADP-binding domain-containing protein n=1 Tax=Acer yangbiense TaxID=1000413 RepID=A0A5C7I6W7_9ROSI|nr:hypothetical protein EZV62_011879 [Acer yangbiense]